VGPATLHALLVALFRTGFDRRQHGVGIQRIFLVVFHITHGVEFKHGEPVFTGRRDKAEFSAVCRILHPFHDEACVAAVSKHVIRRHLDLGGRAEFAERRAFLEIHVSEIAPTEGLSRRGRRRGFPAVVLAHGDERGNTHDGERNKEPFFH
jgi:hypothetical protein